ncbi:MAG: GH3 auxin-responsive promoter family protein, partial [Bacteroidales bacterium]|nr:GH3 auxin-responsive promoter family protein [Bacteroidales bacterium]
MDLLTPVVRIVLSHRVRAIRRFGSDFEKIQRRTLRKLVRAARCTVWGREHGYDKIRSYADFARQVPFGDFGSHKPYIERMMKGERDVLWPGRVKFFATSSGTTSDRIKFIPVSDRGLTRCHKQGGRDVTASYLDQCRDSHVAKGYSLILSGNFNPKYTTETAKVGDVSAIMTASIHPRARKIMHILPETKIAQIQDIREKYDAIAELIMGKNMVSFSGTPDWNLVLLRHTMEKAGVKTAEEMWPNMEFFAHGGMSFLPYRPIFDELFPSGKIKYIENYNASEGFFGFQNDLSRNDMILALDYEVFYEFVPMHEYGRPDAHALPLWQTEVGVDYALVISTSSGLWRYFLGDVVRFTQKAPYRFVIVGRTHQCINLWGEDLSMQQAEKALADTCAATGAKVLEFTVAPLMFEDTAEGRHQWLIEFDHRPDDLGRFAHILEKCVREEDHDYFHFSVSEGGILH